MRLKVYSVKLPDGLPEQLRDRYGVPFSSLVRLMLEDMVKGEKKVLPAQTAEVEVA